MNKASNIKSNKKSKVEREMEKLSNQLQQKEIKPMEYAKKFPMKIDMRPQKDVIREALSAHRNYFDLKAYEKNKQDIDIASNAIGNFVIARLSNLKAGYEALKNIEGGKEAFKWLLQRAINESKRAYPWLDGEYYHY
ncbi:hypothetical protein LEP1GSC036_2558 [Leptospira weilii str. 2006001853]|uniref:Uncharacterized protein n=1 Tax=Leptospira weilii str. 2006001853 TaxID=1001589 RepID=A0A828Z1Q6_9LEPT|nr:hypothetical protein [Leptospira weilii]EKR64295.1 hypothetical protein LEP1GSC036_2558 [Leptospira weilii str. 2006001853]MCL8268612.1 hypothetical protein [Leptospira weilii]